MAFGVKTQVWMFFFKEVLCARGEARRLHSAGDFRDENSSAALVGDDEHGRSVMLLVMF